MTYVIAIRAEQDRIVDLEDMESRQVFAPESGPPWNAPVIAPTWSSPIRRRLEQPRSLLKSPGGLPLGLLKALTTAVRDLENGSVHACAAGRRYILLYFGGALVAATLDSCKFSDARPGYPDGLMWYE